MQTRSRQCPLRTKTTWCFVGSTGIVLWPSQNRPSGESPKVTQLLFGGNRRRPGDLCECQQSRVRTETRLELGRKLMRTYVPRVRKTKKATQRVREN